MSLRKEIVFLLLTAFLFACAGFSPFQQGEKGKLAFEETFFNFGTVTEGDVIKHTFKFRNEGAGPVWITGTKTSCGCTTAAAALRKYEPGESGEMEVTIDTKGKKGSTNKTVEVRLRNSVKPVMEISLMAELTPPPHPPVEPGVPVTRDAKCKSCHLESAEGFSGIYLYHRVCSQCHGKRGVGASARALDDEEWLKTATDDFIRNTIRSGIAEQNMPPFVDGVTPPLTAGQVDSLVAYIRSLEN
ncbi:MAG: DUF1573 domain-containing protein [Nitrospinae bacterium]|nr:DUF1573 domain-containing protein [Nitrospinota bacterium]